MKLVIMKRTVGIFETTSPCLFILTYLKLHSILSLNWFFLKYQISKSLNQMAWPKLYGRNPNLIQNIFCSPCHFKWICRVWGMSYCPFRSLYPKIFLKSYKREILKYHVQESLFVKVHVILRISFSSNFIILNMKQDFKTKQGLPFNKR